MSDLLLQLAQLTDAEAEQCLNRIVGSLAALGSPVPSASADDLARLLSGVAADAGVRSRPVADRDIPQRAKAVRAVLVEFTGHPELSARLAGALAADRNVLVEPITIALVMAGIVFVLGTRFDVKLKRDKDGKVEYEASIGKDPTATSTIEKLMGFFSKP